MTRPFCLEEAYLMKKIYQYLKLIGMGLRRSIERFPETLSLTVVLVILFIVRIHMSYTNEFADSIDKWLMALVLGVPILASAKLIVEKLNLSLPVRAVAGAVGIGLIVLYRMTIPENITDYFMMRYFALMFMLFIGFLTVPYFYKREGLSQYILYMAGRFFLMLLYSGVIFGGTAMMIFTIESLFDLSFTEKIYMDLFILVAGLFSVTFYLGSVPEKNKDVDLQDYSKIFKTLFLYILIPIISIYLVILYAYFVKILIEFEMPKGLIGNLVLWHAAVSVLTLFFVRDLKSEIKWLEKFSNFYIPLMIVPIIMLFLALGIRIDAYGITMPRYFVVALAIFATLAMGIMRIFKTDTAIPVTILLVAFIGISFFGPLSGYAMTLRDQLGRLETMMESYDLLDASGNLVQNTDLEDAQKREVSNQIQFLMRNYEMDETEILPADFNDQTASSYLGFELYGYWYYNDPERLYFHVGQKDGSNVLNVEAARYLLLTDSYTLYDQVDLGDGISVSKDSQDSVMKFMVNGTVFAELDIEEAAVAYYLNQDANPVYVFELDKDGKTLEATLMFRSLNGYKDDEDSYIIDYYDVWIQVGIME